MTDTPDSVADPYGAEIANEQACIRLLQDARVLSVCFPLSGADLAVIAETRDVLNQILSKRRKAA